jgi:hypothetical protein
MTVTTDLTSAFVAARRVSTPLVKIDTADPAATVEGLVAVLGAAPVAQWDLVRGLVGLNAAGAAAVKAVLPRGTDAEQVPALTGQPTDTLRLVEKFPRETVLFMLNLPRYWDAPDVAQALWNLRDPFKASKRMVVGLGPDGKLPKELEHDVTTLVEPLPGRAELEGILATIYQAVKQTPPTGRALARIVDAMSGLSAFAAEQVCAMSMTKQGVDVAALRKRRQQAIENTPGLSIYKGADTFADLGGMRQLIAFFKRVAEKAKEPIKAIAFIDELDKAMAGTGTAGGPGDSTGVSQDALKVLLTGMQDNNSQGAMLYGVPGAGKTAFAKALANELGVELILWDLGAMQASLVGQSQANVRMAMKVTNAVGQGNVLYLATCNGTATIPTELRRRFRTFGEWFFDLPAADETPAILKIYLDKYGLAATADNPLPDVREWTGAEIKSLCYLAYDLDLPFKEAAQFVVPMVTSAPEVVAKLRGQAEGKFLSVSDSGFYCAATNRAEKPTRDITLDDVVTAAVAGTVIGEDLRKMKES